MSLTDRSIATSQADIRITVSDGTGLPLLMLHGGGADRHVFDGQFASQLAERHRLIGIDLPGNGQSGDARDPTTGYALPGLATTIAEVFEALSVDRAVVFGWSLGGHVGIEMLGARPDLVAGLMITGAPPVAPGPLAMLRGFHANWDMLLASKEKFSPRDVERYGRLCYGDFATPALLDAIRRTDGRSRAILARSMMRGDGVDQKRTVETARVPVAVVNGEHDPFVRLGYVASLDYRTLWDGRTYVLPGAGHAAFRDAPERFNALLLRFAADCAAYRAPLDLPAARRA